jgi:hypothetical protein
MRKLRDRWWIRFLVWGVGFASIADGLVTVFTLNQKSFSLAFRLAFYVSKLSVAYSESYGGEDARYRHLA